MCEHISVDEAVRLKPAENKARVLVGRAAANFSVGGRASEVCCDLGEAFAIHPATARLQFQRLFSDNGTGVAARIQLRQQAERGLSGYRETALARPDLRSTKGLELLDPVIAQLRTLCHLEPDGGGRELRVRLADCLLLHGEFREALSISSQLAGVAATQQSYQNTVQVLRGYARLLSDDHQGALEDFQAVMEHRAPHPSSCVRALCGRGLLRMMAGSHYLTALDYLTASRLQPQETAFTVRCLVPWNYRGLLCTVLLEQGRAMLEDVGGKGPGPSSQQEHKPAPSVQGKESLPLSKDGSPGGVHALALLLMELQPGSDAPQILTADALYRLGRVEEAYRLLLSIEHATTRSPILARLALLQLHRGFLYDANQLLKKLIQCGDTSCLRPLLAVAAPKDRILMEKHCYTASKRTLEVQRETSTIREAVAYLSIAIMASGGEAVEPLLERARCYALLGQRKTAIFDFTAILKDHPEHVPALCGRAFTHLTLNQQKECTADILAALRANPEAVAQDILSLKDKGRKLICEWLLQFCQTSLSQTVAVNPVPCLERHLQEAFLVGAALLRIDGRDPRWHLLYIDTLLAKGDVQAAAAHLGQVFGQEPREASAQARWGVVEAWEQNFRGAAQRLAKVAEREPSTLDFLLPLVSSLHRKHLGQAASQEASRATEQGQWESALPLLTVAVRAVDELKPQYLRQRAACLAQLGLHERAVLDLDKVIRGHGAATGVVGVTEAGVARAAEHGLWAEDLCRRGHSLLLCSREQPAVEDFSRALGLHRSQTLECVEAGAGRARLARHFLHAASRCYAEQQLSEAWTLTQSGLQVDAGHAELRRLKARIKQESSTSCIVH
ncbi:tetratricopeptide repeat protein 34 [Sardina pilchardus]|uniref:tetratricopeptide repeat protein 34 n=1 Tax=Sardina pilchardus TaxID=27697 RepID=UPI002E115321